MATDCTQCSYRKDAILQDSSRCTHPIIDTALDETIFAKTLSDMTGKPSTWMESLNINEEVMDVVNQSFWPMSFDPALLTNCDGFDQG